MPVYKLDKLMDETRRLAAEFRASTGNTLPVSAELAKHDAMRLLNLQPPSQEEKAVDAYLHAEEAVLKVQVKSRVIFDDNKSGQRIGQLNLEAGWDLIVLVIMDDNYRPIRIYQLSRERLDAEMPDLATKKKNTRGAMSVRKFEAIAELCWSADDAPESQD